MKIGSHDRPIFKNAKFSTKLAYLGLNFWNKNMSIPYTFFIVRSKALLRSDSNVASRSSLQPFTGQDFSTSCTSRTWHVSGLSSKNNFHDTLIVHLQVFINRCFLQTFEFNFLK
jgi:hypothetical protein